MFKDGQKLPDTFDEWLETAQRVYDQPVSDGFVVEKAWIEPDAFPEWCRAYRHEMDIGGRTAYAHECVARRLKAGGQ